MQKEKKKTFRWRSLTVLFIWHGNDTEHVTTTTYLFAYRSIPCTEQRQVVREVCAALRSTRKTSKFYRQLTSTVLSGWTDTHKATFGQTGPSFGRPACSLQECICVVKRKVWPSPRGDVTLAKDMRRISWCTHARTYVGTRMWTRTCILHSVITLRWYCTYPRIFFPLSRGAAFLFVSARKCILCRGFVELPPARYTWSLKWEIPGDHAT